MPPSHHSPSAPQGATLQKLFQFHEARLDFRPGCIRAVAELAALRLILCANRRRQTRRREERVAPAETHLIRMEIALRKMGPAVFVSLLVYRRPGVALAVFALAASTDLLDGYVARRSGSQSRLGAFLDPIADKLLLTASFVTLTYLKLLPFWITAVVITRDVILVVGALLIYMERRKDKGGTWATERPIIGRALGAPAPWTSPCPPLSCFFSSRTIGVQQGRRNVAVGVVGSPGDSARRASRGRPQRSPEAVGRHGHGGRPGRRQRAPRARGRAAVERRITQIRLDRRPEPALRRSRRRHAQRASLGRSFRPRA